MELRKGYSVDRASKGTKGPLRELEGLEGPGRTSKDLGGPPMDLGGPPMDLGGPLTQLEGPSRDSG